ncbi:MAG: ABC transporter ATP-binding protein [Geminicoccaceae bacterium]|jgi:subfamily B ATP-binding cassette protein MsbA|nr:ABC transporter ATP-binding protein [Geminicoccaceae bacterium]MCB9967219.1 ABC transporter ATP-binding protein [Geminicoccaceae bacterium]
MSHQRIRLDGDRQAVRALFALCGRRRVILIPIIVLAILAFLLEGMGIGLLIPLVDTMLGSQGQTSSQVGFGAVLGTLTDWLPEDHRLTLIVVLVCLLIVLKAAVIYGHHMLSVSLTSHVGGDLRDRLFRQTFDIGLLTIQRLGIGRLNNTIDIQVWKVCQAFDTLTHLTASMAASLVFLCLLLLISWPLTLAVIGSFLLVSLIMLAVRRAAQRRGRELVGVNADLSGRIVESLTHQRMVRAFGTEHLEMQRFHLASEAVRRAVWRTELLRGIVAPATELLYVPLMFGAIGLGLLLDLGMPALVAYLLMLYRLQPHLREIDRQRVELAAHTGPIEDVVTLLDIRDETAPRSGHRPITRIQGSIRFEGVSFDYGVAESAGVDDISFTIPKGATVALVGPSGAGKSTLIGLLFRFFDPTAGRILVDDVPLTELNLADWRRRLTFAGQDVELMSGTVYENIAYGSPDASDEAIRAAARLAHADHFIAALPGGYDAPIGARGLNLSGGQRQRLTLARAMLRRPDVLILDEATNSLDSESEDVVLQRLHAARGDMTLVVIAHRLRLVRHADLVVVLDNGRAIECGPPAELMSSGGAFDRLWRRQSAVDHHDWVPG